MSDTILITGGAGFVGSSIAINLKRDNPGYRILAFDNLKRRGSELNIPRLRKAGVDFIHGDVRNKEDLASIGHFDLLVDCSAEPSVLSGFNESPEYLINTNLLGTVNCLESIRKNKANLIFLSTSRVYPLSKLNNLQFTESSSRFNISGNQKLPGVSNKGISEEFPLEGTRSLYGATKLCSELLILEYIQTYGIQAIINRCGLLTGPWQMGKTDQGVIVLWVAKHIYNGKLSYIGYGGKGKQVRDLLHIDDLYDLLCLEISQFEKHNGKIYNVGGGPELSISLMELTTLCRDFTKNKVEITSVGKPRDADIFYYVTDTSKVQAATGWKPKKSVRATIQDIADWISSNKDQLRPILDNL